MDEQKTLEQKSMNTLKGKIVLVTGAAGSIGSAILKKVSEQKPKLLLALDNNETGLFDVHNSVRCTPILADIRDEQRMDDIFHKYKPEVVFHAAAYKHVGMCERHPEEAHKTNVLGLMNVMDSADAFGAKRFVFISSDKAVRPTCVMGMTKKEGEILCRKYDQRSGTKFSVVRFGNVVNSRGSVFEIWGRRIADNLPLIVNHRKMQRYFMGIFEAVDLVLEAAKREVDLAILDMGEQVYMDSMAKMMIRLSKKDLGIVYTKPSKGEKFQEELMTKEEGSRAKKVGKLWMIKW